MIEVTWQQIKDFSAQRTLSLQWIDLDIRYWIGAFDGPLHVFTLIHKTEEVDKKIDFETNYQSISNKPPVPLLSPLSSKTFGNKKLYARNIGIQQSIQAGSNAINYTITFPWVKIVGVEIINCEALDNANFIVKDDANGTYSGTPNSVLNQFAFSHNLPKDFYSRMVAFDADLYLNMVINIQYVSMGAKTIGVNFLFDEVKS